MWFGLLHDIPDDAPVDGGAMVILYAWVAGRDRPLSVGCQLGGAPEWARMLREAGTGAAIMAPRCDACGVALDLPLD